MEALQSPWYPMMMTMSDKACCCDDCFDLIAKRSADSARLWLDLCDIYYNSNAILMIGNSAPTPSIRTLETLGFILTTETQHMTYVRVLGEVFDGEERYFCGGRCHE